MQKILVKMALAVVVITFVTLGVLAVDSDTAYANYNEECLREGCDREEVRELYASYNHECHTEGCFYEEVRELAGGASAPVPLVFDRGQMHYQMFGAFRGLFSGFRHPCYGGYSTPAWNVPIQSWWQCWPNFSAGKNAIASSVENGGLLPHMAFDENPNTRWSSQFSDPQWIYVDLEQTLPFNQIVLNWEVAYSKRYGIWIWNSSTRQWNRIYYRGNGDGGYDYVNLPRTYYARWVALVGYERGTGWGHSLWNFGVDYEFRQVVASEAKMTDEIAPDESTTPEEAFVPNIGAPVEFTSLTMSEDIGLRLQSDKEEPEDEKKKEEEAEQRIRNIFLPLIHR